MKADYCRCPNSDEVIVVIDLYSILYASLRIYVTTSGLLSSSLTNPFFEDATWSIGSAS